MRRQLLPIVIAATLIMAAGSARADGYAAPKMAAAPMLTVSSWTGFYANGGVGYGLWNAETSSNLAAGGACIICAHQDVGGRGWLGEVGLGYDYQVGSNIVVGAFFNYDFSDMDGRLDDGRGLSGKTSNESTWFVGARGGWLMTPDVLNYWGVGYTRTRFDGATLDLITGAPFGANLAGYDASGWFISGGIEVAMHGGWYWRSEARYADYSSGVRNESNVAPLVNINFDPVVQTATSEIVYKFNWGH